MRTNAITKLTTKTNCVGTGEFYAARDHGTSVTTTRGECYQAMRKSAGDLTATLRRDPLRKSAGIAKGASRGCQAGGPVKTAST